jgi:septum site-determining protein MinD
MAGHIIVVIGGKGGVGKSQFAANLAFAFSMENRQKTLLLDFDQKACGDQNLITGMRSKKNILQLSTFAENLDQRSIMTFVGQHKLGVHFIGMPTDSAAAEQIDVEGLGKSLKAVTNIYPLTIIDAGSELNDLAVKALEYATMITIVVTPDLLAVNQSRRLYSDLQTMLFPKEMIQVIVNQFQKGHPVTTDTIGKQIGRPVFSLVPKDDQGCIRGLSSSSPVITISKNSPLAQGVVDTVRRMKQKNILAQLARLKKPDNVGAKPIDAKVSKTKGGRNPRVELKSRIHKALVEEIDMKKHDSKDEKAQIILREKTKKKVIEILDKEDTKTVLTSNSREEKNKLVKEILDEALGLGPLEDLLSDKSVSEIMVIGPDKIYYEQNGKNKRSEITFTNDRQVLNVIERIVSAVGRRIDEKTPYVDARLHDGSRVHAIIKPCALDGGTITIRKFPEERITYKQLVGWGSITDNMAHFLRVSVENHRNIVVSGGTGSGKTTLINVLGSFIPSSERIITCEDSAELNFPQEHVVRLETKPASLEGDGAVDIRCLVKQTLRMKPDRIVVGECRGGETLDMLQAMNTGHDGSMTTVHSNTPRDCISRLETLVQYAGAGISPDAIKKMIASAVHMIVQQSRLDDGSRKITYITEVAGMQGDMITLQDIFKYEQTAIGKGGKIEGKFVSTGFIPKFIEKIEKKGVTIPRGLFSNE